MKERALMIRIVALFFGIVYVKRKKTNHKLVPYTMACNICLRCNLLPPLWYIKYEKKKKKKKVKEKEDT